MERNLKSVAKMSTQRAKAADSISSFISVSIILLAFLVALNANRNTEVSDHSSLPPQFAMGEIASESKTLQKEVLLRQKIPAAAIFRGETASLSNQSYQLFKALSEVINSNSISSILVLNSNDTNDINLTLERAATLNRFLLDSGIPQELFSIVTKTSTNGADDYLTILFKEGHFYE